MALLSNLIISTPSNASSTSRLRLLHGSLLRNVGDHRVSVTCSAKFPGMEQFYDPAKLRERLSYAKDQLWECIPGPVKRFPWKRVENVALQEGEKLWKLVPGAVKQFPWKKAENVALQEGLVLGKEVLKWTLIAYFALSFVSDFLYTISRNKELIIPFGLFAGCLMANYFDEIAQEVVHGYKIDNIQRLLGIACLFVLIKFISVYFSGGSYFLVHSANGGLMQLFWKWSKLPKEDAEGYLMEDALNSKNTGD